MKRSRKRTLLMVLLLLTGGAIINVAVAWGMAMCSQLHLLGPIIRPANEVEERWWKHRPFTATSPHASAVTEYVGNGCQYQMVLGDRSGEARFRNLEGYAVFYGAANALMDRAVIVRAGFPSESVRGDRWDFGITLATPIPCPAQPIINWKKGDAHRNALSFDRPQLFGGSSFRMLGWQPIWPGFAINTIFYAAILWLLVVAPGFVRRRLRARRGQCPACAYPVGASDVCTECGRPVKQKAMGNRQKAIAGNDALT